MMTKEEIQAYIHRIGIQEIKPPPLQDILFELYKAHVEKLPWQTLDIFAGNLCIFTITPHLLKAI
ncbi:hypothetical protein WQ54_12865 [Bacillus sp. SA1-12]|nr:hypothetical protein WQ54_12865 [Bacillus sp. SA1-12]